MAPRILPDFRILPKPLPEFLLQSLLKQALLPVPESLPQELLLLSPPKQALSHLVCLSFLRIPAVLPRLLPLIFLSVLHLTYRRPRHHPHPYIPEKPLFRSAGNINLYLKVLSHIVHTSYTNPFFMSLCFSGLLLLFPIIPLIVNHIQQCITDTRRNIASSFSASGNNIRRIRFHNHFF